MKPLTLREHQVRNHLVQGHSNKDIARALGISYRTVEEHRARGYRLAKWGCQRDKRTAI